MFKRYKLWKKISDENTGLSNEFIRGIKDVKLLNVQDEFLKLFRKEVLKSEEEIFKMNKIKRKYDFIVGCLKDSLKLIFITLGIILYMDGYLAIASFLVLYNYQDKIYNLLNYIFDLLENLKSFNVSANRVFELIENKKFAKEKFGKRHLNKIEGNFEFKNVTFSYEKKVPVIKNMSFKINANETVAFVGKSGSGKTTIFNLLTKLYDTNKGSILIDNINIKKLDQDSIRNNISIITQNPYIFNFSIKDNLKIVKPDMTDEEMKEVCKIACIHDFIMRLPKKYDTIVGEGGLTLSGGQKQRLAIARALLKQTEIILFDEATSALDNETQHKVQTAIMNLKGEYTIMIIAHRLSTIINCHKLFYIEDGQIKDVGTHKELIKRNKNYKDLYEADLLNDK